MTQSWRVPSVFQSESEQDEEGTGSMGSAAVAVSLIFVSPLLLVFASQVKSLNIQVSGSFSLFPK